ncbi:MAG: hypothetical protein GTO41_10645, partial [Burkholderiales bacterium]|nr:hypothetical protein [Burkholderiales bacterium]
MLDKLGANFGKTTRWVMLDDLQRYGVEAVTESRALEITEHSVKADCAGVVREFPADTVVLAT